MGCEEEEEEEEKKKAAAVAEQYKALQLKAQKLAIKPKAVLEEKRRLRRGVKEAVEKKGHARKCDGDDLWMCVYFALLDPLMSLR